MSIRPIGIIITILGTYLLAISTKNKTQFDADPHLKRHLEADEKAGSFFMPNKTVRDNKKFWGGLLLIAVGSLLQI